MTAISSVSKPPLVVALEVLANIRSQGIVSADDILDEVELGDWRTPPVTTLYDRFGESFVEWARHKVYMERIFEVQRRIASELISESRKSNLKFPMEIFNEVFDVAMTRLKKANCGPLSTLAAVEASEECSALVVDFRTEVNNHRFVILDNAIDPKSAAALKGSALSTIFAKYPKGVVLDPLLKIACSVSEVASTRLVKYMEISHLEHITEASVISRGSSQTANILQRVENMYQRLNGFDLTKIPCENINMLNELLNGYLGPESGFALEEWFPGTTWTNNVTEGVMSLSMDGTDETTKPISDLLKTLNLSVKRFKYTENEGLYKVELTNPNAAQLCAIASISQVFQNHTSALQLILSYIQ